MKSPQLSLHAYSLNSCKDKLLILVTKTIPVFREFHPQYLLWLLIQTFQLNRSAHTPYINVHNLFRSKIKQFRGQANSTTDTNISEPSSKLIHCFALGQNPLQCIKYKVQKTKLQRYLVPKFCASFTKIINTYNNQKQTTKIFCFKC